jgi:hypothetical protein
MYETGRSRRLGFVIREEEMETWMGFAGDFLSRHSRLRCNGEDPRDAEVAVQCTRPVSESLDRGAGSQNRSLCCYSSGSGQRNIETVSPVFLFFSFLSCFALPLIIT